MDLVLVPAIAAIFIALVAMIPKGNHFSQDQLREAQKDIKRIASAK